jgi:hypothetical protein
MGFGFEVDVRLQRFRARSYVLRIIDTKELFPEA